MDSLRHDINDLRRKLEETDEVISMLKSTSESRSIELLKALRSDPDISVSSTQWNKSPTGIPGRNVFRTRRGMTVWQPSSRRPSQSSLEFELTARHHIAYPTLHPVEEIDIDLQRLFDSSPSLQDLYKERK